MGAALLKHTAIPLVALALGGTLHMSEKWRTAGKLIMYFGAQTGMNIYMKAVLSHSVVSEEQDLKGIPAPFAVTAIQQITAFVLFLIMLVGSRFTPYRYHPKRLQSAWEWFVVTCFAFTFTLNIALNNFSLSLLAISINLIIRSCAPVSTLISQMALHRCGGEKAKDSHVTAVSCMMLGTLAAAVAVFAKTQARAQGAPLHEGETENMGLGVITCVASLFSGSLNLALAGVLGTSLELNSLDTTCYMSVPALLFLVGPVFLIPHPVGWTAHGALTDWQVISKVVELSPATLGLAVFSGVLAFAYNILQYGIVQTLSASHTAFAGNFNKAATIVIALVVGLEGLPEGRWGILMAGAVFANIAAFTAYNISKERDKLLQHHLVPCSESAEEEPWKGRELHAMQA